MNPRWAKWSDRRLRTSSGLEIFADMNVSPAQLSIEMLLSLMILRHISVSAAIVLRNSAAVSFEGTTLKPFTRSCIAGSLSAFAKAAWARLRMGAGVALGANMAYQNVS